MACLLEILRLSGPSYAWPHSNCEVELLARYYGAQMTSTLLEFEDTVYGILPTEHPARLLQLNRFLTGGLTPWEIREAMNTNCREGTELYIESSQSIRSVIDAASAFAVDIRTSQYFKDGNHRTCLLALALALAEYGVVLTSSFHMYRAYTILSARFHLGNESNSLDAAARADAHRRIVRYLRRRTVRGVADSRYLATVADAVRQLPIIVSHVEEVGTRLRTEQDRPRLNWAQKVVVKWTFPEFNKGRAKIR